MSITILEGIPRVGKTSYLTYLKSARGYHPIKNGEITRNQLVMEDMNKIVLSIFKSVPLRDSKIIFDRFYPSEIVFGSERYKVDLEKYKLFDEQFAQEDFKLVFLHLPYDNIMNVWYTRKQYEQWYARYLDFLNWTKLPTKIISNKTYSDNCEELNEYFI